MGSEVELASPGEPDGTRCYVVDLLTVLAPGERLRPEALAALDRQGAVELRFHSAEGKRRPGESRVETIARARNAVKQLGESPLAMFLDRDVVLPEGAIAALARALEADLALGAVGIDYGPPQSSEPVHVAMGAVMFRREVLSSLSFRAEPPLCECWCCCRDLRARGLRIEYLPGFRAEHRKPPLPF